MHLFREGREAMDIENSLKLIISMFDSTVNTYENNCKTIRNCDLKQNDVAHKRELSKRMTVAAICKLHKEERENLIVRRKAKDENELLKELYDYCIANKHIKKEFSKMLSNYNNKKAKQSKRIYTPRISPNEETTVNAKTKPNLDKMIKEYKRQYKERQA